MDGKKLDALERLGRLRDAGALSEEEFQAEKQAIMKGPSSGPSVGNSAASSSDQETRAPAELLGPMTERHSGRSSEGSRVPVWGRKRRGLSPWGIAGVVALVFLTTLGGAMWFLNRADYETYSFVATGPANVRDEPTATAGKVVGQLADGDFISGRVQGSGDQQWVEITEGALRGRFVWAGNLASEGPDDMLGGNGQAPTQPEATTEPPLAARSPEAQVRAIAADMDCSLLNATVATMICARQVMSNIPNSSGLPGIRGNLQVTGPELHQRCSAQIANKVDGTAFIVQQQVAAVYEEVAPQTVYGGDLSAVILDSCTKRVMGSMARAGLL